MIHVGTEYINLIIMLVLIRIKFDHWDEKSSSIVLACTNRHRYSSSVFDWSTIDFRLPPLNMVMFFSESGLNLDLCSEKLSGWSSSSYRNSACTWKLSVYSFLAPSPATDSTLELNPNWSKEVIINLSCALSPACPWKTSKLLLLNLLSSRQKYGVSCSKM